MYLYKKGKTPESTHSFFSYTKLQIYIIKLTHGVYDNKTLDSWSSGDLKDQQYTAL